MPTADLLRSVPILAGLSDDLLQNLAEQVEEVRLNAGTWLMRAGDRADSVYIVASGRLDVIDEGPPERVIRVLRRGDVLGELALLSAGTRSASARAARDAQLLELNREPFEQLIQQAPGFALALTREMGARLSASHTPIEDSSPPRTVGVVGLDRGAPVAAVGARLAAELSRFGSVATLTAGELATIDQAERDNDNVVLVGTNAPEDPWTEICMREAELVVALCTGVADPSWMRRSTALHGCELIVFGSSLGDEMLAALRPREAQVVAEQPERDAAVDATARRIAGRALGIVFSGGGARALAHLGVLEELRNAGVRIDRFGGVSLGAVVAASAAAGFSTESIYDTFERSFVTGNPSRDYVLPAYSLIRGAKVRGMLRDAFGDRRIEQLPGRFFCLSCDLIAREEVVHRSGLLCDALYASVAIPGVFPPLVTESGQLLVDGGVRDNLPVAAMARTGEGPVLAVDVTGQLSQWSRGGRPRLARLRRPARRLMTGSNAEVPRLGETIVRTVTVGSADTVAAARKHADVVISPRVEGVGLLDWKAFERMREQGRNEARATLESHPELLTRLGG